MKNQLLFSAQELRVAQENADCVVVDCRFILSEPGAAYGKFLQAHIPGAVYAHLDDDLSSPVTSTSGRHPLPDADQFAAFLARSGWQPGVALVAYDDVGGAIAARLWWLMKYFGHTGAALLDGGIAAWRAAGYELAGGPAFASPVAVASFTIQKDWVMSSSDIVAGLKDSRMVLADARAPERFLGEIEPIDSRAGHIPGAVNYPYTLNLDHEGMFKTPEELRSALLTLAGGDETHALVHMCGSGVTACHNIFAGELAGVSTCSKLYVGSWSEWIRDPSRPVEP